MKAMQVSVSYFAVYKDGRRCAVTQEAVERNAEAWAKDGWTIETDVATEVLPVHGKLNLTPNAEMLKGVLIGL